MKPHTTPRHCARCTHWQRPEALADVHNSLHDTAVSLAPGKMLVYATGRFGSDAPTEVMSAAVSVASSLGLALVQWPSARDTDPSRHWLYAMQKRGQAA